MSDITELFDKLSLGDDIDNVINEFSKLSIKYTNEGKEIDTIIDSFEKLTIIKQEQCINVINNNIDKKKNIKIFLDKIGFILINRYNKKCYIENMYINNYMII